MMNTPNSYTENGEIKLLLNKIKQLQEVVNGSGPSFSDTPPAGYTLARWQLALQSFNERFPAFRANYLAKDRNEMMMVDSDDAEFDVKFGPEWELKCAQKELEHLLNKESEWKPWIFCTRL